MFVEMPRVWPQTCKQLCRKPTKRLTPAVKQMLRHSLAVCRTKGVICRMFGRSALLCNMHPISIAQIRIDMVDWITIEPQKSQSHNVLCCQHVDTDYLQMPCRYRVRNPTVCCLVPPRSATVASSIVCLKQVTYAKMGDLHACNTASWEQLCSVGRLCVLNTM